MSVSEAAFSKPSEYAAPAGPVSVRPIWLRPAALACILALHAGVIFFVAGRAAPLTPLDAVEVTLEPQGDSAEDQVKQEEVTPAELPPPAAPAAEQAELTAPPPEVIGPEAIPLPVEKPRPIVKPKAKPAVEEPDHNEPTPAELQAQKRRSQEAAERRRKAQEARMAQRRGVANAAREAGMSRGNYAGLLAAELRRRQFYPAAARAQGATGSVGVAFTVGPSGRVVSQSITNSSGSAALDGAARAMMSAVHTPPPPGGSFSTSTTIRFHLN